MIASDHHQSNGIATESNYDSRKLGIYAVPPQHLDSERAILGGAIISDDARREILSSVTPTQFYLDIHANILRIVARLDIDGKLTGDTDDNTTTIISAISESGIGSDVTGGIVPFLLELMGEHQSRFVDYHCGRVTRAAMQRKLISDLEESTRLAWAGESADAVCERLVTTAETIRTGLTPRTDDIFKRYSLEDLTTQFPDLDPPLIDGWLRSSSVGNLISKSKIGKSWLAYVTLLSVAAGWDLFGMTCRRSRVLLLDNELKKSELQWRMNSVAAAMGMDRSFWQGQVEIVSMRGNLRSITSLEREFRSLGRNEFGLIVVDALYRMMPDGVSENDNSAVTAVYNCEDHYAAMTGAAILNIHHSTKGDQAGRDIADVGSGAGAQSRAADAHIILRPHEEPDCVVMESVVRSFPPSSPKVLRWNFPLWTSDTELDPEAVKGRKPPREERKSAEDAKAIGMILAQIQDKGPSTVKKLIGYTGIGRQRLERLIGQLHSEGRITSTTVTVRGNECEQYQLPA